jgi:hypothetical protein
MPQPAYRGRERGTAPDIRRDQNMRRRIGRRLSRRLLVAL